MADSGALLRLLEPAVRPVPQPTGESSSPAGGTSDPTSFEQRLAEAKKETQANQTEPGAGDGASDADPSRAGDAGKTSEGERPPASLQLLSGIDRVENPTLRRLIEPGKQSDEPQSAATGRAASG